MEREIHVMNKYEKIRSVTSREMRVLEQKHSSHHIGENPRVLTLSAKEDREKLGSLKSC